MNNPKYIKTSVALEEKLNAVREEIYNDCVSALQALAPDTKIINLYDYGYSNWFGGKQMPDYVDYGYNDIPSYSLIKIDGVLMVNNEDGDDISVIEAFTTEDMLRLLETLEDCLNYKPEQD